MDEIEAPEIFFGAVNSGRKFRHFRGARDLTLGVFGGVFRKHVSSSRLINHIRSPTIINQPTACFYTRPFFSSYFDITKISA
jgi:hypothetical protein